MFSHITFLSLSLSVCLCAVPDKYQVREDIGLALCSCVFLAWFKNCICRLRSFGTVDWSWEDGLSRCDALLVQKKERGKKKKQKRGITSGKGRCVFLSELQLKRLSHRLWIGRRHSYDFWSNQTVFSLSLIIFYYPRLLLSTNSLFLLSLFH